MRPVRLFRLAQSLRVAAVLACALLLTGCNINFGSRVSMFDDEVGIARALGALQSRYSGPMPTFKVVISDSELVVQAESPGTSGQLVEWQLVREQFLFVTIDRMYGPRRIDPVLINKNLQQNLFDLKQVDFAAWAKIADAAIARVALQGKSGVATVELSRPIVLVPNTSSGPVRWSIEVKSTQESARVFAGMDGKISGVNLAGTERMRNLNMYQRPDLAVGAAAEVRKSIGAEPVLLRVAFNSTAIEFETTLEDKNHILTGLKANAVYNWSFNGLTRTMGRPNISGHMSNPDAPFGVDEVDWETLPKIVADAQTKLAMPNGRVTSISVRKPTDGIGKPVLIWNIDIEENRERGSYKADVKGTMKAVALPASRRKAADWLSPGAVVQSLNRIGEEFGTDTRIVDVTISDRNVVVNAEDPRKPGTPMRVLLGDDGFKRFGTPILVGTGKPYTMNELKLLDAPAISAMAGKTLETLQMPPGSVVRVTIGRGFTQTSQKGTVTVEVRAESPDRGHGWVVFELDGSVVSVMQP